MMNKNSVEKVEAHNNNNNNNININININNFNNMLVIPDLLSANYGSNPTQSSSVRAQNSCR